MFLSHVVLQLLIIFISALCPKTIEICGDLVVHCLGGTPQFIWVSIKAAHLKSSDHLFQGIIRKQNSCIWDRRISL